MGAAPPAGGPANTQAAAQGRLSPSELSFDTVCRLMNALRLTKSAMKKRDMLQKFIAVNIEKQRCVEAACARGSGCRSWWPGSSLSALCCFPTPAPASCCT